MRIAVITAPKRALRLAEQVEHLDGVPSTARRTDTPAGDVQVSTGVERHSLSGAAKGGHEGTAERSVRTSPLDGTIFERHEDVAAFERTFAWRRSIREHVEGVHDHILTVGYDLDLHRVADTCREARPTEDHSRASRRAERVHRLRWAAVENDARHPADLA